MRRYRPEKLKKGEGRDYEVRVNLGEDYVVPSRPLKWRLGFDERGAYWTRFVKQRNRADACRKISDWYSNSPLKKVLGKKGDEVLEVKDHYNEVVYHPSMLPSQAKNKFLPQDKLAEIVKLSKGLLEKNVDFVKTGSFIRSKEFYCKRNRERYIKVPDVPYVYESFGRYYALVQLRGEKSEGGYHNINWKCVRKSNGEFISTTSDHKRGKVVQQAKRSMIKLKHTNLQKAVKEAVKLVKEKSNTYRESN
tara:strand:+ start:395 stop:1141 length:747 start_codon:yes stop_codon:yes gene_type:complete